MQTTNLEGCWGCYQETQNIYEQDDYVHKKMNGTYYEQP